MYLVEVGSCVDVGDESEEERFVARGHGQHEVEMVGLANCVVASACCRSWCSSVVGDRDDV